MQQYLLLHRVDALHEILGSRGLILGLPSKIHLAWLFAEQQRRYTKSGKQKPLES